MLLRRVLYIFTAPILAGLVQRIFQVSRDFVNMGGGSRPLSNVGRQQLAKIHGELHVLSDESYGRIQGLGGSASSLRRRKRSCFVDKKLSKTVDTLKEMYGAGVDSIYTEERISESAAHAGARGRIKRACASMGAPPEGVTAAGSLLEVCGGSGVTGYGDTGSQAIYVTERRHIGPLDL